MIIPPPRRLIETMYVRQERKLAPDAKPLVKDDDFVFPSSPLARLPAPEQVVAVPVAQALDIPPEKMGRYLLKQLGESVEQGEVLARREAGFRRPRRECFAPVSGTVMYITRDHVGLRPAPTASALLAEAMGYVRDLVHGEGLAIEDQQALLEGVLGVGDEAHGRLMVLSQRGDEELLAAALDDSAAGTIVVGGVVLDDAVLGAAEECGVAGLVLGSVPAHGYQGWLTGEAEPPVPVVLTDGFGPGGMNAQVFDLLRRQHGQPTWLRAFDVGRAEVAISLVPRAFVRIPPPPEVGVGAQIRVVAGVAFGTAGRLETWPPVPQRLPNGLVVPVVRIASADGQITEVPAANLEVVG